jgi:hypothetical protein
VHAADQKIQYNAVFEEQSVRPHIAGFRTSTNSQLAIGKFASVNACTSCKRWLFAWPDVPGLASDGFIEQQFDEYMELADSFYNALQSIEGLRSGDIALD